VLFSADELHRESLVVAIHDHRPIASNLQAMAAGGVTAKVYQVALDVDVEAGYGASASREEGWLRLTVSGLEAALGDIGACPAQCFLATKAGDVERAKREGRIAIFLGAEGARWLEGQLEPLRLFHRLGLREFQLSWAFPTPLVSGGRLSSFGREVVDECRNLGILVDLTHIPEKAFYEAVELSERPVIVSHGSASGVTTDLDDGKLRAIASTGGLLGVHFYTTYLGHSPTPEHVFRQIDYVSGLVGIEHVALGVDFFPTEGPWRDIQAAQGTTDLRWAIRDMSEMPLITGCLVEHGYSAEDVRKVLGLNFIRVCREVFGE
jgi:membrane dipeptidase